MLPEIVRDTLIGLLPVLGFLAALIALDSYKLVGLRTVIVVVALGAAAAGVAALANGVVLETLAIDRSTLARYVAPPVEELVKALIVVVLVRTHRIGFLIDAAILGFAVGAGFAVVENLQYQRLAVDVGIGTWIVRGFGTAIMHGGVTSLLAMIAVALLERGQRSLAAALLPGWAAAAALHSLYNHMLVPPLVSMLTVLAVLPVLMILVFRRGERAIGDWLGRGFDADADLLQAIESGAFSATPAGRYLASLRDRLEGPVVADLLCYLRLHTELALRAKGLLMMRENGFDVPVDDATLAKFEELRFLERSVGRTGLLAARPLLRGDPRDLWQLGVLR